jgi:2-oxoglutarate dehydrogenase E2 component (dihydrolipoamide succinyltransferase)
LRLIAVEILAPAEQTEGTRSQVLRWLKNIGEPVAQNEPLIEIETDKVTVEVASPGSGILREIVKGEQEEVAPGEVLGRLEVRGEAVGAGAGGAMGSGASGATATDAMSPGDLTGAGGAKLGASPGRVTGAGLNGGLGDRSAATQLSPAVRRLLSEHSLDASTVRGTGLGGRITVEDVLAAVAAASGSGRATARNDSPASAERRLDAAPEPSAYGTPAGSPHMIAQDGSSTAPDTAARAKAGVSTDIIGGSHRIPHTAVRKRIAEHMVQSLLHTAPHVTTVFEADMTAVLTHREKYRAEFGKRGVPLTLTAYFLQAIVDAIGVVPEANSRWTDTALEVFDSIHIGVGTALEDGGLVVPVLRDVQSLDLFSTAQGLNDLVTRAREGRLTPADVRGGTFTISNHGVSGSLLATPIVINQPQAAILGVGKLEKRPVVVEDGGADRVVIQPRCYVTLTIDHRVMDGHQANRFMQRFVERLTNWT